MISLSVDNNDIHVRSSVSIIETCRLIGINIPRFCYHEILSTVGNCRMCLVEIEGKEKPTASCVTEVEEGMSIFTNSAFVKKARENVIEILLLNHPLDCPICDQAGECDLQDQAKAFGSIGSKYFYPKKPVEDKNCGPLIKTIMTRCISCTRCVRYGSDFAGEDFFGTLNRGRGTEIGPYTSNFFKSEISGNVIDLCPVGALTSNPNAFKTRPWELRVGETIDITDSLGSKIYINYKETEINRILPKNTLLNENIISDKARFVYDANSLNRIVDVFFKKKVFSKYSAQSWLRVFEYFQNSFSHHQLTFLINYNTDIKSVITLKRLKNIFPKRLNVFILDNKISEENTQVFEKLNLISNLKYKTIGSVIFLGSNPKIENPVINARIRNRVKDEINDIFSFGFYHDYNYFVNFFFASSQKTFKFLRGKSKSFSREVSFASQPLFIIGDSYKDRISSEKNFGNTVLKFFNNALINFLDYNLNISALKFSGFKELNFNKRKIRKGFFFANQLNNTTLLTKALNFFKKHFIIWNHTHGNFLSHRAKVILPTLTTFESEYVYFNIENLLQSTKKIINYDIGIRAFNNVLVYLFAAGLFKKPKTVVSKFFKEETKVLSNLVVDSFFKNIFSSSNLKDYFLIKVSFCPIVQKNKNYYTNNVVTENSLILSECYNETLYIFENFG